MENNEIGWESFKGTFKNKVRAMNWKRNVISTQDRVIDTMSQWKRQEPTKSKESSKPMDKLVAELKAIKEDWKPNLYYQKLRK